MQDRFKFRAGIKTKNFSFVVPITELGDDYFTITFEDIENVLGDESLFKNNLTYEDLINEINDQYNTTFQDNYCFGGWFITDLSLVQQCTGLKDSEGNLIYDGDVLHNGYDEPHCIVKYCDKCSALTTFYPHNTKFISTPNGEDEVPCDIEYCCNICDNNCSMQDQFYEVKIIGNIYQNPELLAEEKPEDYDLTED